MNKTENNTYKIPIQCKICDYKAPHNFGLAIHKKINHSIKNKHSQNENRLTKSKYSQTIQNKTNDVNKTKNTNMEYVQCKYCEYKTCNNFRLVLHKRKNHSINRNQSQDMDVLTKAQTNHNQEVKNIQRTSKHIVVQTPKSKENLMRHDSRLIKAET